MENGIRDKVKEHYGSIASKVSAERKSSCCGSASNSCGCDTGAAKLGYTKDELKGLPGMAVNASLGCANPLMLAGLKEGEAVLDLGSGGGIDVLAASKYVGATGKAYGLDMTDEMLKLANENKRRMGAQNVEFLKGYIEDVPLPDNTVDAVISNCVINLSEDKSKVLSEAYRVLKPGGRFAVADIVALKAVPESVRRQAEMWYGCLGGALEAGEYRQMLEQAGFHDVTIEPVHIYTKKVIEDDVLDGIYDGIIDEAGMDSLDGMFAGTHIKAIK
jgi:SAM-dependent methyltransferase